MSVPILYILSFVYVVVCGGIQIFERDNLADPSPVCLVGSIMILDSRKGRMTEATSFNLIDLVKQCYNAASP